MKSTEDKMDIQNAEEAELELSMVGSKYEEILRKIDESLNDKASSLLIRNIDQTTKRSLHPTVRRVFGNKYTVRTSENDDGTFNAIIYLKS